MAENILDRFKNVKAETSVDASRKVRVGIIGCGWIAEAHAVLGVVGAIGAAKAVSDSVSDRLSRRKAIDDAARDKKERIDQWEDFKGKAKNKIKRAGRYIKDIVTEDYRKEDKNSHEKKSNKK